MADRVVSFAELRDFIARIFVGVGASEANARIAGDHLAGANLCGVDTHGARQVTGYVEDIRRGWLIPDAEPQVVREHPGALLVAGGWSFGQVAAEFAVTEGLKRLEQQAVVLVGVVQCHHLGRVGHYPELAAAQGAIAVVCGGGYGVGSPITVPFGGREPIFNTNPLAYAAPAPDGRVMADFATTAGANARVLMAREGGEPLPEGFAVDANGHPTTDATAVASGGALLPFGGHKGYGLNMMIGALAGVLNGAAFGSDVIDFNKDFKTPTNTGQVFFAMRPDIFRELDDFKAEMDLRIHEIRNSAPMEGKGPIRIPGENLARRKEQMRREGVPVAAPVLAQLRELVGELGLEDKLAD